LLGYKSKNDYPEKLRRIKYNDADHDLDLVSLTNKTELNAAEIVFLHMKKWEVE